LQVVDHDQAQATALPMQPPATRAQIGRIETGRLIDKDRGLMKLAQGIGQPLPLFIVELAGRILC
jgi:hypothetical protein